jgi:LuxR family transcriptional regulator, maltose regulon positive regulatory protein
LWYEQQALLTDALEAALLARDVARIALLVEQVDTQGYFYELQTMLRWLAPLPETVLHAHPMLCFIFAVALRFSQEALPVPTAVGEHVEALLAMAEAGWRRQEQWPWIGAIWAFRALSATEQEPFAAL